MKKYMNPRGMKILDALDAVARRWNATPAQISLAWLMARPGVTAPIASATNLDQLQELLRATEVKLDAGAIAALERASD
jgi:aryl-alcohol dehydrogenase-like predicted oxidoreductase